MCESINQVKFRLPDETNSLASTEEIPSKLTQAEYIEVFAEDGFKYILCDRIGMFEGIEEEVFRGSIIAYKCPQQRCSANEWIRAFKELTKTTFVIARSSLGAHGYIHAQYQCHRRVRDKSPHTRVRKKPSKQNLDCPVVISIKLCHVLARPRSKKLDAGYCMRIKGNGQRHNHSTTSPEALRFRPVSRATDQRLVQLFRLGHTPVQALRVFRRELQDKHGDAYPAIAVDGSHMPGQAHVYSLYYRTFPYDPAEDPADQLLKRKNSPRRNRNRRIGIEARLGVVATSKKKTRIDVSVTVGSEATPPPPPSSPLPPVPPPLPTCHSSQQVIRPPKQALAEAADMPPSSVRKRRRVEPPAPADCRLDALATARASLDSFSRVVLAHVARDDSGAWQRALEAFARRFRRASPSARLSALQQAGAPPTVVGVDVAGRVLVPSAAGRLASFVLPCTSVQLPTNGSDGWPQENGCGATAAVGECGAPTGEGGGDDLTASGECDSLMALGECGVLAGNGECGALAASDECGAVRSDAGYDCLGEVADCGTLGAGSSCGALGAGGSCGALGAGGSCSALGAGSICGAFGAGGSCGALGAGSICGALGADGDCSVFEANGGCSVLEANGGCSVLEADGSCSVLEADGSCSVLEADGGCSVLEADGSCSTLRTAGSCGSVAADADCGALAANSACVAVREDGSEVYYVVADPLPATPMCGEVVDCGPTVIFHVDDAGDVVSSVGLAADDR